MTALHSAPAFTLVSPAAENTAIETDAAELKAALRQLGGGVSVIAAGKGAERSGATVTSATALSMEPPRMLVLLNKSSSTWPVVARYGHFSVNILGAEHEDLANRFAGRGGLKGAERYEGADWATGESGAPVLAEALASVDCVLEDAIERHSHVIVIGRAVAIRSRQGSALAYRDGRYAAL